MNLLNVVKEPPLIKLGRFNSNSNERKHGNREDENSPSRESVARNDKRFECLKARYRCSKEEVLISKANAD
jgi:hypothetical protein